MAELTVRKRAAWTFWWWLALFIVGLAFVVWALSPRFGAEETRGRAAVPAGDWSVLTSVPDLHPLLGSSIRLTDVKVADVTTDKIFWGSAPGGKIVLVVDERGLSDAELKLGQTVEVTGTVHRVPEWNDARSRWNIPDGLRERVEEQRLYLIPEHVRITAQP